MGFFSNMLFGSDEHEDYYTSDIPEIDHAEFIKYFSRHDFVSKSPQAFYDIRGYLSEESWQEIQKDAPFWMEIKHIRFCDETEFYGFYGASELHEGDEILICFKGQNILQTKVLSIKQVTDSHFYNEDRKMFEICFTIDRQKFTEKHFLQLYKQDNPDYEYPHMYPDYYLHGDIYTLSGNTFVYKVSQLDKVKTWEHNLFCIRDWEDLNDWDFNEEEWQEKGLEPMCAEVGAIMKTISEKLGFKRYLFPEIASYYCLQMALSCWKYIAANGVYNVYADVVIKNGLLAISVAREFYNDSNYDVIYEYFNSGCTNNGLRNQIESVVMPNLNKKFVVLPYNSSVEDHNKSLSLTASDNEYLDEYKDILADYGEIGPRERKRLEKTRTRLGLSENRVSELEASVQGDSDDFAAEQEYLEEYSEMKSDYGEIGARERKLLEKTRVRLGISEERAKQIESLAY